MSQYYTAIDHLALVPAIMLALFGSAILLLDHWVPDLMALLRVRRPADRKWIIVVFLLPGLAFTGMGLWNQQKYLAASGLDEISAFHGALVVDGFSLFFNWVFLAATLIVALISYRYLDMEGEHHGEYYGLMLISQCGMYFLATGADLVTLLMGLETMAICFYILVGFLREDRRSNEAAMKYLILGAFSSGILAYGFSLLYGMCGSTLIADAASAVAARGAKDPLVLLALGTTAIGLLFKVSAAPFHMWAPDAYEGAPTTVTAYLSVASKAASFAFLMRILLGPLGPAREAWEPLLALIAVITMTVGNLAAISQPNVKRLLAYSSISHAGYMLLGLVAGNSTGLQGVAVYILVYAFMNLGAFLVIVALRQKDLIGENVEDLAGLVHRAPGHAILMLVFLLSLAGIPPTAGFLGKYYIFLSLIQTGHYLLAVIATLYVAVAIYYYFRIVRVMFQETAVSPAPLVSSLGLRLSLAVTGVLTIGIGVYPEPFLRLAETSLFR